MTFFLSVLGPLASEFDIVDNSMIDDVVIKINSQIDVPDGTIFTFLNNAESINEEWRRALVTKTRSNFIFVTNDECSFPLVSSWFSIKTHGLMAPIELLFFETRPRSLQFLAANACRVVPQYLPNGFKFLISSFQGQRLLPPAQ